MSASHPTIFLVDDDLAVLAALSRLLRVNGYEVRAFRSAQTFLNQHDVSLVGCAVLDLAMPELDGLELQSALSQGAVPRRIVQFESCVGSAHSSPVRQR